MANSRSDLIKSAARQVLMAKRKGHIFPLAVTVPEVISLCPGITTADVVNELAALALADGCRLSETVNKDIMLLWQPTN